MGVPSITTNLSGAPDPVTLEICQCDPNLKCAFLVLPRRFWLLHGRAD